MASPTVPTPLTCLYQSCTRGRLSNLTAACLALLSPNTTRALSLTPPNEHLEAPGDATEYRVLDVKYYAQLERGWGLAALAPGRSPLNNQHGLTAACPCPTHSLPAPSRGWGGRNPFSPGQCGYKPTSRP